MLGIRKDEQIPTITVLMLDGSQLDGRSMSSNLFRKWKTKVILGPIWFVIKSKHIVHIYIMELYV